MRRLTRGQALATGFIIAAVSAVASTAVVWADGPQQTTNRTPDGFTVEIERPGGGTTTGGGQGIACSWTILPITASTGDGSAEADLAQRTGVEEVGPDGRAYRTDPVTGGRLVLYYRSGPDCASGPVWVSTALTPRSLIPPLRREITKILPLPTPNMSPAPAVGSVVNLGLWLAIEDPGNQSLRLTDGPVWAEGNGTLLGFNVDFGNGDTVDCDGLGTPYPDGSNDPDEGPCGYTYLQRSGANTPYQLTITARYDVTYLLSNGESGSLGTVERPATFDYPVREIQTVGTGR